MADIFHVCRDPVIRCHSLSFCVTFVTLEPKQSLFQKFLADCREKPTRRGNWKIRDWIGIFEKFNFLEILRFLSLNSDLTRINKADDLKPVRLCQLSTVTFEISPNLSHPTKATEKPPITFGIHKEIMSANSGAAGVYDKSVLKEEQL